MRLTAGCLQYVSSAALLRCCKEHLKDTLPPAFPISQSGIYIEVIDLGRVQRKLTEDLSCFPHNCCPLSFPFLFYILLYIS